MEKVPNENTLFSSEKERKRKKETYRFHLSIYIFSILDPAFTEYICNIYINTLTRLVVDNLCMLSLSLYSDFSSSLFPTLFRFPLEYKATLHKKLNTGFVFRADR